MGIEKHTTNKLTLYGVICHDRDSKERVPNSEKILPGLTFRLVITGNEQLMSYGISWSMRSGTEIIVPDKTLYDVPDGKTVWIPLYDEPSVGIIYEREIHVSVYHGEATRWQLQEGHRWCMVANTELFLSELAHFMMGLSLNSPLKLFW